MRSLVTFRLREAPGRRVELAGDLPLWTARHPVPEVSPGEYALTLALAPGLYRYKFVLDGRHWVRDPDAPADFAEGSDNSVVTVGGTHAPLFFAEDRRHLVRAPDGTLRLCAEVAEGHAPPPRVWALDAKGASVTAPVRVVGREGGRVLLRAELPVPLAARDASWGFEGVPEHSFRVPRPQPRTALAPAWAKDLVWYAIFVDRWFRGAKKKDPRARPRTAPSTAETFYGGDLEGVRQALPALRDLGVGGVVLTPIHRSETPHRYDTVDHFSIDPRLGGAAAADRLLDDAHRLGLRVAADLVVTHVNAAHPFFRDVLRRKARSKYAAWFKRRADDAGFECYVERAELPLLDLSHPPARAHVIDAALALVRRGFDALRLDAMTDAPPDFWAELRAAVRAERDDVALLGEVVMDAQPACLEDAGADCVTDFQHREALRDLCLGRLAPERFLARARLLEHRQGPFDASSRLRLLDTHDTERFASMVGPARARLALAMLLFSPEPVWLTWGTERELASYVPLFRLDDAWPERLPMPPLDAPAPPTLELVRELLHLRRSLAPGLRAAAQGARLFLERATLDGQPLRLVLNFGDVSLDDGAGEELPPWSARVVGLKAR